MNEQIERVLDAFERKERGIPQAHIAAQLVSEIRAAIQALAPVPDEPAPGENK